MFRASSSVATADSCLGKLVDLEGKWVGRGFNVVAVPDRKQVDKFSLRIAPTFETTSFANIGAPFPDRGSAQDDISICGLQYTSSA